jgi:hypothetical protein
VWEVVKNPERFHVMANRLLMLKRIPFAALVTTNFNQVHDRRCNSEWCFAGVGHVLGSVRADGVLLHNPADVPLRRARAVGQQPGHAATVP